MSPCGPCMLPASVNPATGPEPVYIHKCPLTSIPSPMLGVGSMASNVIVVAVEVDPIILTDVPSAPLLPV